MNQRQGCANPSFSSFVPNVSALLLAYLAKRGKMNKVMDYADGGDVHMKIKSREVQLPDLLRRSCQ